MWSERDTHPVTRQTRHTKTRQRRTTMFRKSMLASLAITAAALGASASPALAGYSTVAQCTTLSGTAHYAPGLKFKAKPMQETITGTISGCSVYGNPVAGDGTFTATLSAPT